MSDLEIAHQLVIAAAHKRVVVGIGRAFKAYDFKTIAFERPCGGLRIAVADAELGHYAAVAALAVGSDVEIKQMCVGILDRTGYS